MTQHIASDQYIDWRTLRTCMVLGAIPGLILISAFLFAAGEGNPEWGAYWRIRPLIVVPAAGAMGGGFFYFMTHRRYNSDAWNFAARIVGLIVYAIGIWFGSVIGLAGTHWN
jgi:hypothetical protein